MYIFINLNEVSKKQAKFLLKSKSTKQLRKNWSIFRKNDDPVLEHSYFIYEAILFISIYDHINYDNMLDQLPLVITCDEHKEYLKLEL